MVNWTTPLSVPDIFSNVYVSAATLHVPVGTKAFYQTAKVWKDFGTIVEQTPTTTLSVSSTSLSFTAPGEQKTFIITSNTNWTISNNATWLSVSPTSGSNNSTVTVISAANMTNNQRTSTITVSGAEVTTQIISVTQDATKTIMYVMKNGKVVFKSPVSGVDNITFDKSTSNSALIVHKNNGSLAEGFLLNYIQQLFFLDENLFVEKTYGIDS